ncbi:hypothetical protein WMF31_37295 [Sorangium sp. So ce1036]|uniref:hypothetical protein n=1 Tax=Sorangium sp. So ce1036 TaxID=3133328 RepID=UPI003F114715
MSIRHFFIYLLPIITILLIGLLGRTRRIGFLPAIIASILFTPLGGFLLTLFLGPKRVNRPATLPGVNVRKA